MEKKKSLFKQNLEKIRASQPQQNPQGFPIPIQIPLESVENPHQNQDSEQSQDELKQSQQKQQQLPNQVNQINNQEINQTQEKKLKLSKEEYEEINKQNREFIAKLSKEEIREYKSQIESMFNKDLLQKFSKMFDQKASDDKLPHNRRMNQDFYESHNDEDFKVEKMEDIFTNEKESKDLESQVQVDHIEKLLFDLDRQEGKEIELEKSQNDNWEALRLKENKFSIVTACNMLGFEQTYTVNLVGLRLIKIILRGIKRQDFELRNQVLLYLDKRQTLIYRLVDFQRSSHNQLIIDSIEVLVRYLDCLFGEDISFQRLYKSKVQVLFEQLNQQTQKLLRVFKELQIWQLLKQNEQVFEFNLCTLSTFKEFLRQLLYLDGQFYSKKLESLQVYAKLIIEESEKSESTHLVELLGRNPLESLKKIRQIGENNEELDSLRTLLQQKLAKNENIRTFELGLLLGLDLIQKKSQHPLNSLSIYTLNWSDESRKFSRDQIRLKLLKIWEDLELDFPFYGIRYLKDFLTLEKFLVYKGLSEQLYSYTQKILNLKDILKNFFINDLDNLLLIYQEQRTIKKHLISKKKKELNLLDLYLREYFIDLIEILRIYAENIHHDPSTYYKIITLFKEAKFYDYLENLENLRNMEDLETKDSHQQQTGSQEQMVSQEPNFQDAQGQHKINLISEEQPPNQQVRAVLKFMRFKNRCGLQEFNSSIRYQIQHKEYFILSVFQSKLLNTVRLTKLFCQKDDNFLLLDYDQSALDEYCREILSQTDIVQLSDLLKSNSSLCDRLIIKYMDNSFGNRIFTRLIFYFTQKQFPPKVRDSILNLISQYIDIFTASILEESDLYGNPSNYMNSKDSKTNDSSKNMFIHKIVTNIDNNEYLKILIKNYYN